MTSAAYRADKVLEGVKAIVVPDLHQDVAWVKRILAREERPGRHLVLLGDYFDPKGKGTAGVRETCAFLRDLMQRPDVVFLVGNHDLPYWESRPIIRRHATPKRLLHGCSGFTASKAKRIHKELPNEFWARLELFKVVNGWLVSHAGLVPDLWPKAKSVDRALRSLAKKERRAIEKLRTQVHPLLAVGHVRGGMADHGGFAWADYRFEWPRDKAGEFLSTPMPQIFGHVSSSRARAVGNSLCLDGRQSVYGLIGRKGKIELRVA